MNRTNTPADNVLSKQKLGLEKTFLNKIKVTSSSLDIQKQPLIEGCAGGKYVGRGTVQEDNVASGGQH